MTTQHKSNDEVKKEEFEQISAEEQQAILEKYDIESNVRTISGVMKHVIFFGLLAFSLFQLYTAIFGQFPAQIQRTIHLGFGLTLIFLLFPARKKAAKNKIAWFDYILAVLSIVVGSYWTMNYTELVNSNGTITQTDFIVGLIAVVLVLEAARRAVGLPITIIAICFLI
ncbi:C4-dicarboxylate ABC transporter, partial [Lysinibacillus xylanilyticus]